MSIAFVDRPPSMAEMERLRLVLSAYQDGSGMLALREGGITLPGWRDFERAVAGVFGGFGPENKEVFDVLLDGAKGERPRPGVKYGLSCKMRRELGRVDRDGRVTIELSNSAKKFWAHLERKGITHEDYKGRAREVGEGLIELVKEWHYETSIDGGGGVDLEHSFYLSLMWSRQCWYQLYQFGLELPDEGTLEWRFPGVTRNGGMEVGSHLSGDDGRGVLFEWYGESGGQLKYYPFAESAVWSSPRFRLERLPGGVDTALVKKAELYFGALWPKEGEEKETGA